ncbi:GxxExxY protein [Ereboglobus sp. PH5-5]|uniref:GxxExxY protein n=1 Tax=unclassified Ereboglobus TaxID=2626932 RepID=UPI002405A0D9|nr:MULTISPECIES: GxxExxY protein [unclassified Ereboglobus]MDF9825931.1 GxxExxY protein [Ereboglobus sp. PH5-10]MDF9833308.1 GxxExxY protein [Ereboglobus sp. PH5-5]
MKITLLQEELTEKIIGAAIEVHKVLGPGLLESTYEAALAFELGLRGLKYERQKEMPVNYKGFLIEVGYRLDLLVENEVVLELKAVEELHAVHEAQLITYLKLSGHRIGFLINFNVPLLKDGIFRRVL